MCCSVRDQGGGHPRVHEAIDKGASNEIPEFPTSRAIRFPAHASHGCCRGGSVYNLGTFSPDVYTIILGNHASTSNYNVFG